MSTESEREAIISAYLAETDVIWKKFDAEIEAIKRNRDAACAAAQRATIEEIRKIRQRYEGLPGL